jgi:hypothetical protein
LDGKCNNTQQGKGISQAVAKEGEQMKDLIAKLKDPKTKAALNHMYVQY